MKLLPIAAAAAMLGAGALPAQDLPQWMLQLVQIKRKAKAEFVRLPNFACVETINRFHRMPRSEEFKPMDTVRLEVAFVDGKELFAPIGGSSFHEIDLSDLVRGGGAMGTGAFSAMARNLFVNDNGRVTGWGEDRILERPALRYDFVIPEMFAGYRMQSRGMQATVGLEGTFWADAETLELLRVVERAVDIPPGLDILDSTTTVTYARMRIAASDVLLPRWAEMVITNTNGWRGRNEIEFTGCREYVADSVIRFDTVDPPPTPKKK
ncbi:MAG: hypothetical protein LAQ69_34260 [Acidobacteriia bacterium]|nr:hypothetical protein [Terriglobia bacterium]